MAVQTAKAFRTALRKEPLQNFYYLYGADLVQVAELTVQRSEERRVGKECRSRWSPYH